MGAVDEPVRAPSVVRAWLVAHEARSISLGTVVLVAVLCLGAQWLLPLPGQPRKVPLWQLTPALLAVVASLATVNQLPSGRAGPHQAARGAWACAVITFAAGCSWVVGLATTNLPSLVPGTVVTVALTFGVSVLAGRMSVWVGSLLALVVLARVARSAASDDLWTGLPGTAQIALGVTASLGVAAYARLGADGARMSGSGRGS